MRVALVAPFGLRPKGTTIARVVPIGRALVAQGAEAQAFIPPWDDRERAGRSWTEAGLEINHTPIGVGPMTPVVVMSALLANVARWQPDVVHVFKPIGYGGAVAWRLATQGARTRESRPLVVVDCDDFEGPAGWAGRRDQGIPGRVRGIQERATIKRADAVTVASRWLGAYAHQLGVPEHRIRSLPNGHDVLSASADQAAGGADGVSSGEVDDEALQSSPDPTAIQRASPPTNFSGRGPDLLWYTRFTEANPERVAALLAPLFTEDHRLRLIVLGDEIEPGARFAAQRAFDMLGLAHRTEWRGFADGGWDDALDATRSIAIYPLDDDLVNRARCPSKIPQLMALGLPLVAEAVGEAGVYLHAVADRCLVEPGAPDAFRASLRQLLAEAAPRAALSIQLRQAADEWTWRRVTAGLLDWYATMKSDAPSRGAPA